MSQEQKNYAEQHVRTENLSKELMNAVMRQNELLKKKVEELQAALQKLQQEKASMENSQQPLQLQALQGQQPSQRQVPTRPPRWARAGRARTQRNRLRNEAREGWKQ